MGPKPTFSWQSHSIHSKLPKMHNELFYNIPHPVGIRTQTACERDDHCVMPTGLKKSLNIAAYLEPILRSRVATQPLYEFTYNPSSLALLEYFFLPKKRSRPSTYNACVGKFMS
jgi:hypothetical protein